MKVREWRGGAVDGHAEGAAACMLWVPRTITELFSTRCPFLSYLCARHEGDGGVAREGYRVRQHVVKAWPPGACATTGPRGGSRHA